MRDLRRNWRRYLLDALVAYLILQLVRLVVATLGG